MSIFSLVIKNILQRKFSVFLTVISVSLGVALIASTLAIKHEVEKNFNQSNVGYEMIVGAKGSAMQLVLNTVFMLGDPVGNISFDVYDSLRNDRRVALALPYALGDNYRGFKIVGSTDELFSDFQYKVGQTFSFREGSSFEPHSNFQAVLGHETAKSTGLKIDDQFVATHGLQESGEGVGHKHEDTPFKVVGILNPTGTTSDKVIFTTVESVWAVHEHEMGHAGHDDHIDGQDHHHEEHASHEDHTEHTHKEDTHTHHHDEEHEEHAKHDHHQEHHHAGEEHAADEGAEHHASEHHASKIHTEHHTITDLTAILVKVRSPLFALQLYKQINDAPIAQAAIPAREINNLFQIIGNIDWAFLLITFLVIVVALIGMMVAIYNSLYERRREISIMRALGAHRSKIFGIITLEAFTISFLGAFLGLLLSKALSMGLKSYILQTTGVEISINLITMMNIAGIALPIELLLLVGVSVIGALVAMLPAFDAYKTDVSRNLSPIS